MAIEEVHYVIDRADFLMGVNAGWVHFALQNAADKSVASPPSNARIWDYIAGESVRALYRSLVTKVRSKGSPCEVSFRCDAPTLRRTFRMRITTEDGAKVAFQNSIIAEEKRAAIRLFDAYAPRNASLLEICSMCHAIQTEKRGWQPLERMVEHLKLLEAERVPAMSHGLCSECREKVESAY